jgi:hypothetical protein
MSATRNPGDGVRTIGEGVKNPGGGTA